MDVPFHEYNMAAEWCVLTKPNYNVGVTEECICKQMKIFWTTVDFMGKIRIE